MTGPVSTNRYTARQRRAAIRVLGFLIGIALAGALVGFFFGVMVTRNMVIPADPEPTIKPVSAVKLAEAPEVEPTEAPIPETTPEPELLYTPEELEMLALVIYAEAGGDACTDTTRQMVGEVVLNRVADKRFPDTLYDVLTQPWQYGRFCETGLVWPERADLPGEAHAVNRAYECAEALLSDTVTRLLPKDVIFQAEFRQGTETVAHQDGLYFCK